MAKANNGNRNLVDNLPSLSLAHQDSSSCQNT